MNTSLQVEILQNSDNFYKKIYLNVECNDEIDIQVPENYSSMGDTSRRYQIQCLLGQISIGFWDFKENFKLYMVQ